jgi:hypothetical protein
MKSDISNSLSEVLQCEHVTMPKAQKVKKNWFKLYQQINSKINNSGSKKETTGVLQGTSCSVLESDTSSAESDTSLAESDTPLAESGTSLAESDTSLVDSDIAIVFDSKAEKMRRAEQAVINIDSDDDDDNNDDISVDHVDRCKSDGHHDTGTLHCSADSGPVADICYADVQNINSLELSTNIPVVPENIHLYEGTSETVSDSCEYTGR